MGKLINYFSFGLAIFSVARAAQAPVNLGSAVQYVILAKSGITTTGPTHIDGNIAVSPIAGTAVTGFNFQLSPDGRSCSSSLVAGAIYAADFAAPTPGMLTRAVLDMESAYNDAAIRPNPDTFNFLGGQINNLVIYPGLHKWTSTVTLGGINTITGSASDVFIFQISGTLDFSPGSRINLDGGAQASNVFFQAAGAVTLGSQAAVQGIILGKTGISFGPGASLNTGRALAQTAVTLIGNHIRTPF